jgi:hypothetical protein
MRLLFITFLCLGVLVMILAAAEMGAQVSRWSSLIAWAQETGVLQNEKFAQHLSQLPSSPFTTAIIGTGLLICILAIWRLIKETRPKNDPPI